MLTSDSAALWGLLWNGFGAAIIIPIYCYLHLRSQPAKRDSALPLNEAKALVATTVLGSLLPLILMLPPFLNCKIETQQAFTALFQLTPVIFVSLHYIAARCIAFFSKNESYSDAGRPFVHQAWVFTGVCSATAHGYVLMMSLFSQNSATTFSRVYIPSPANVNLSASNRLTEGGQLFLQYDFIIISLTCILYAYLLLEQQAKTLMSSVSAVHERPGLERYTTLLLVGLVTFLLGPGAVVSFAFALREDTLSKGDRALKTR